LPCFGIPNCHRYFLANTPLLQVQGVIEIVGGILLLVGAYTRVVAFVLAGDVAVAYFVAHLPRSVFPAVNGGDAAVLFCFAFLYILFAGGGPWSVVACRFFRTFDQATASVCMTCG
jgi:putative oxidoreductase